MLFKPVCVKIVYVVNQFPKLSESFVINEIHELNRRGHDVSVFATGRSDETVVHEEVNSKDMSVYYPGRQPSLRALADLFSKYTINPVILPKTLFRDNPTYHVYCLQIAKQIMQVVDREGGVDLIHAHFAFPDRLAVTYAASYYDIPCTVTAHANEIFTPSDLRRLQRVCAQFDHVIVPSEYNKRYLREEIGVETDISVVPATTNVEKFEPGDNTVSGRLLTVARLVEKKGHEYAIDAVAELVDRGYDVEYHIVGTGEREEFLRNRVRQRGLEDRIEFLGHVSDERLERELQEAEVFVLPCVIASDGDRDVAPVALKEAMVTETACISTTVSAIPELITDSHDGILVEPNDSDALAQSLIKILENTELRKEIAENARKTVEEKFDIADSVNRLSSIFSQEIVTYE